MTKITINDNAEKLFGRFDFPTFNEFTDKAKLKQDESDSDLFPSSVVYDDYSPFPKLISIKCEFARASDVEYPCKHENEYAAFMTVELCNVEKSYGEGNGTHSFMTYAYTDFSFYAGMPRVDVVRELYNELRDKVMSDMTLLPIEDTAHEACIDELFGTNSNTSDETTGDANGISETVIIDFNENGIDACDETMPIAANTIVDSHATKPIAMPGTATDTVSESVSDAKTPTDLVLYTNEYGISTMMCKCDYDKLMNIRNGKNDTDTNGNEAGSDSDIDTSKANSTKEISIDIVSKQATGGYAIDKFGYGTRSTANKASEETGCPCPACGRVDDPSKARIGVLGWDDAFMATARLFAMRSKDPNTQVGACIVDKHHRILSIGYNGTPNGMSDGEFPWGRDGSDELDKKYLFVCHSELNAVLNFRGSTERMQGATLYVDLFPCNECAKVIAQSGIDEVVYLRDLYPGSDSVIASKRIFDSCGIAYRHYESGYDKIEIPMR